MRDVSKRRFPELEAVAIALTVEVERGP